MSTIVSGLVSTIIPVYNRSHMVTESVETVLLQTYRPIEVILVNDGSTDDTGRVLDKLESKYPGEVCVIHQKNKGPGLAREAGRLVAKGEYIQYLDSDDLLMPDKFMQQVAALEQNKDCDIAYGITRLIDENGNILREPSKQTGERHDALFPALLIDRWWHTSTPLYRRGISDKAGAWPDFRPEDWDLEARMGAHSPKLVYCNAVVSCHREHPGDGRVSQGDFDRYLRNEAIFLPRLYACAIQAGVQKTATEMQHFSRWSFMRARHLAAIGETDLAQQMMNLAMESAVRPDKKMLAVNRVAAMVGWKFTGTICSWLEKGNILHHMSRYS